MMLLCVRYIYTTHEPIGNLKLRSEWSEEEIFFGIGGILACRESFEERASLLASYDLF